MCDVKMSMMSLVCTWNFKWSDISCFANQLFIVMIVKEFTLNWVIMNRKWKTCAIKWENVMRSPSIDKTSFHPYVLLFLFFTITQTHPHPFSIRSPIQILFINKKKMNNRKKMYLKIKIKSQISSKWQMIGTLTLYSKFDARQIQWCLVLILQTMNQNGLVLYFTIKRCYKQQTSMNSNDSCTLCFLLTLSFTHNHTHTHSLSLSGFSLTRKSSRGLQYMLPYQFPESIYIYFLFIYWSPE